jgi:hypothetical protein
MVTGSSMITGSSAFADEDSERWPDFRLIQY